MAEKMSALIKMINLFDLETLKGNSNDTLRRKIMCNEEDFESFDKMYEGMLKSLISGAEDDLLPHGFTEDFLLRLRFLKIKYDEKNKNV